MLIQLHFIRAMTLKELAVRYGISTKTMKRWIVKRIDIIGKAFGRYYLRHQVEKIIELYGPFVYEFHPNAK